MNVAPYPQCLDILSLCTGGGGLDLGVELAIPGARTVCMVEREAFAVAQLVSAMEAGLMAPAAIWSDARTFDGRRWRGCVDGVIGGIPCQPHSLAGRKRGSFDARDLWSDARRIIVQSRAWFVLIENVGGMLSAGDDEIAGAERVHRDLHKLGFEVEAGLFTAAEVGDTQERERIFILAVAGGNGKGSSLDRGWTHDVSEEFTTLVGVRGSVASAQCCGRERGRTERTRAVAAMPSGQAVEGTACQRVRSMAIREHAANQENIDLNRPSIFPPPPGDLVGWRNTLQSWPELEPAFRRMADGLASRLDNARGWSRVDRIRQLGNGVVPLAAAYALRTLSTRLARSGSAGAAFLVRMMGDAA